MGWLEGLVASAIMRHAEALGTVYDMEQSVSIYHPSFTCISQRTEPQGGLAVLYLGILPTLWIVSPLLGKRHHLSPAVRVQYAAV
jgi:hypothetical protein